MEIERYPLVSIIIISYHSEEFILETLESAKSQTYKNIELIISDDFSGDKTVEICKDWLGKNKSRFVVSKIISTSKNTGTPGNCNRGVLASSGQWIKIIAGDDILKDDCISLNVECATSSNKKFIISNVLFFNNEKGILNGYGSPKEIKNFFSKKNPETKLTSYMRNSVFLNSPTYFYSREVFDLNNGFDEEFKVLEDNPFIINTLKNNIDIIFLDKITVSYRMNIDSVTQKGGSIIENDQQLLFTKYKKPFFKDYSFIVCLYLAMMKFELFMKRKGWGRSFVFRIYFKLSVFLREVA